MLRNFLKYCKYSGLSITILCNFFHWGIIPRYYTVKDEWDTYKTHRFSFMFIGISFWIDNGDW